MAVGQPGDADNAQTLKRTAPKVAKYRVALSPMGFAESELRVGEGDGSLHLGGTFRTFNDHPAPYLARLRLPSIAGAFAGMRPGTQDSLEARVRGLPGARYAIESSPDLQAWEPAGAVTVPQSGTTAEIRLPGAANHHFFCLRTLAP